MSFSINRNRLFEQMEWWQIGLILNQKINQKLNKIKCQVRGGCGDESRSAGGSRRGQSHFLATFPHSHPHFLSNSPLFAHSLAIVWPVRGCESHSSTERLRSFHTSPFYVWSSRIRTLSRLLWPRRDLPAHTGIAMPFQSRLDGTHSIFPFFSS